VLEVDTDDATNGVGRVPVLIVITILLTKFVRILIGMMKTCTTPLDLIPKIGPFSFQALYTV
jgi:hypothetical protein